MTRIRQNIARGSAELAILALLSEEPLYGFEISRQIEERSEGAIRFELPSLYPLLYDMEARDFIKGVWQKNDAGRDRRYYQITPKGKKALTPLRKEWRSFFEGLDRLAGISNA